MKAHVIPKSFFVEYSEKKGISKLVATSKVYLPKKSPIGIYDSQILCLECERKFSPYDEYGYRFFHPANELEVVFPGTRKEAFIVRDVDYKLLKLFIISVFWRASVSSQDFFAGVALGPYEGEFRKRILADDPGGTQDFPIFIYRFRYSSALIPILCPVKTKIRGMNFYQLLLNGFPVQMKVDRQGLPQSFAGLALAQDRPLVIYPKKYVGSAEHRIMVRAAKNAP